MNDWWAQTFAVWLSYRPSDFLMFSPRIYWRLFESLNQAFWPMQLVVLALALLWLAWRKPPRTGAVALGVLWMVVAWEFLLQRLAPIHWVATGFAVVFALQGLLLMGAVCITTLRATRDRRRRYAGMTLVAWSLLLHPLLAGLTGRPWAQAEVLGLAPDPTAIATLGLLLLIEAPAGAARGWWRLCWPAPLAWCVISAATLGTMDSWLALVPLAAAGLALAVLLAPRR